MRAVARATARGVSRFRLALAGIVLAGLAVRLVYALWLGADEPLGGDAQLFHLLAERLADGEGYRSGRPGGLVVDTADKPPLYPLLLAAVSKVGLGTIAGHRLVSTALSAATVGVVGLLGRRVGGERVSLLAAGAAALYPLLWVIAGTIMAEALYGLLIALALLAALRLVDRPTASRAAQLGVVIGAAALTRSEGLALLVLLVIPAAWRAPRPAWRTVGVATLACAVVIAPWTVRNALTFDEFVPLSTNTGTLLAGANCPPTYFSEGIGLWSGLCLSPRMSTDDAVQSRLLAERGLDYAREHAGRVPLVALARLGRVWSVYDPWDQARLEDGILEGRSPAVMRMGLFTYYLLLAAAIAGAVILWRRSRRTELLVLAAPVLLVAATAIAGYGIARFRLPAEISIVVLAGMTLDAALRRRVERGHPATRAGSPASG